MDDHRWAICAWEEFRREAGPDRMDLVHVDFHWDGCDDYRDRPADEAHLLAGRPDVPAVREAGLSSMDRGESSAAVRERVVHAREAQTRRAKESRMRDSRGARSRTARGSTAKDDNSFATRSRGFSFQPRAHHRVLKSRELSRILMAYKMCAFNTSPNHCAIEVWPKAEP